MSPAVDTLPSPAPLLEPAAEAALDAVARAVVPEPDSADEAGWQSCHAIVDEALAERAPRMRRRFAAFLRLLDLLSLARFGRPLRKLRGPPQRRLLLGLHDSAPSPLRKGFWGLKALVFTGTSAQARVAAPLGYAPSFSGNERLHA